MLVKLYDLPDPSAYRDAMAEAGVVIRHAMPYERSAARRWIEGRFNEKWADEFEAAFAHQPATGLLAIREGVIVGFACYEATARGFFGPTGVDESERGRGIGAALLIEALHALRGLGYGYGIIGGVGPAAFYAKHVGATVIEGSDPGVYRHRLRQQSE